MASKTQYKVVLLGEGCVGKTSLVMRYVSNTFNEKHITTIQALFVPKRLNLDGQSMTMNIWVSYLFSLFVVPFSLPFSTK